MVDQWKMLAESLEMVVVVEFENLEKCLGKWAFEVLAICSRKQEGRRLPDLLTPAGTLLNFWDN